MKLEPSVPIGAEEVPSSFELRCLPRLEDLPSVSGRRVLVRADLNAPLRASLHVALR